MTETHPTTWAEYEAERTRLGISRAELLRRAGISETTMFKGLQADAAWRKLVEAGDRAAARRSAPKPQQHLQSKLNKILELERAVHALRLDDKGAHLPGANLR